MPVVNTPMPVTPVQKTTTNVVPETPKEVTSNEEKEVKGMEEALNAVEEKKEEATPIVNAQIKPVVSAAQPAVQPAQSTQQVPPANVIPAPMNQPQVPNNIQRPNFQPPMSSVMMSNGMVYQPMQMMMPQIQPVVAYQPMQYPTMIQQPVIPSFNNQHTAPLPPQGNNQSQMQPMNQKHNPIPNLAFDKNQKHANNQDVRNSNNNNNGGNEPKSLSDVLKNSMNNQSGSLLTADENDLLHEYAYNNPDKLIDRPINLAAIIFGPIYYMYRKMLLGGLGILSAILVLLLYDQLYIAIGVWVV